MDVSRVPQEEGPRGARGQGAGQEGEEEARAGGQAGQVPRQDGACFVFGFPRDCCGVRALHACLLFTFVRCMYVRACGTCVCVRGTHMLVGYSTNIRVV